MADATTAHIERRSLAHVTVRAVAGLAISCALSGAVVACSDDETGCAGEDSGDVSLGQGIDQRLPAGGSVAMAQSDPTADPPWLDLSIAPASEADQQAANDLQVDDTFTVAGKTYVVVGICNDSAYLDQGDGPA